MKFPANGVPNEGYLRHYLLLFLILITNL